MKDVISKQQAIFLLLVLVAIGGIVMYGKKVPSHFTDRVPPEIKGPTTPPPGYATPR